MLTAETYVVSGYSIDIRVLLFIAVATAAFYTAHRYRQSLHYEKAHSTSRMQHLISKRSYLLGWTIVECIATLFLAGYWYPEQLMLWLSIIILSLIYLMPWMGKGRRFRDLPYIKIFCISICWAAISTLGALWLSNDAIYPEHGWMLAERFVFFCFLTIPFDMRDHQEDKVLGIKTLATLFDTNQIRVLALMLSMSYSLLIYFAPLDGHYKLSLMLVLFMTWIAGYYIHRCWSQWWWHTYVLDGLIGIRVVLYLCIWSLA